MLIAIPKLVTAVIILAMTGLAFSPLNFGVFYILFRPLVQPWAIKQYTPFTGVPLTALFAIIVITYSTLLCIVRRDYRILTPNSSLLYVLLLFSVISFIIKDVGTKNPLAKRVVLGQPPVEDPVVGGRG